MKRSLRRSAARRSPLYASAASRKGKWNSRQKVIVITTEGKEAVGTVVYERKAHYHKPTFA
ncbi:hypothetical protein [Marinicrinis sediminis]|uniref:Uncharacterized protein n=1 Tax=Marinicrinis sediminis TaxID=1652465 RepID=A0ABW5R9D7_9BACL